jgi:hypothetical protein
MLSTSFLLTKNQFAQALERDEIEIFKLFQSVIRADSLKKAVLYP